jgi:D-alanyl-lipoteichoic acid acyltransferase DltB (MBOAT superfamily)
VFFVDPWFLLAILPAVLAAYSLVHALSTTASAWLLLAVSAAIVARTLAHPLTIAVVACQTIACAVDLQRGRAVIRRAWVLALYLIQFPLLAGGPLIRYTEFSGQLVRRNVGMAASAASSPVWSSCC